MSSKTVTSRKVSIFGLSNPDLLSYVQDTKDTEAFNTLFARLEQRVREEVLSMGVTLRPASRDDGVA